MFKNSGKQLMSLAGASFVMGLIFWIIVGVLLGHIIICIILGLIIGIPGTIAIYAFGELCENVNKIANVSGNNNFSNKNLVSNLSSNNSSQFPNR